MSNLQSDIMLDIQFAEDAPEELTNQAEILRYAAALNPDATRATFVAAAVAMGYKGSSAANRFRESRAIDSATGECEFGKDGAIISHPTAEAFIAEHGSIFGGVHSILDKQGAK